MTAKREPTWHSEILYTSQGLSRRLAKILLLRGSLTAYLYSLGRTHFEVEVLQQQWEKPLPSEARRLNLSRGAVANIREVLLYVDAQALVFGRTVVPKLSVDRIGRPFQRLGGKPLGAMLFREPHLERTPFEWARLSADDALYQRIGSHASAKSIWARRSIFGYRGNPLMLTEVFLHRRMFEFPEGKQHNGLPYHPHAHVDKAIRGAHGRRRGNNG